MAIVITSFATILVHHHLLYYFYFVASIECIAAVSCYFTDDSITIAMMSFTTAIATAKLDLIYYY